MRPATCGLTPEGYPFIFLTSLTTLVFAIIGVWSVSIFFLALCWFSINFFRDPERVIPNELNIAVSPADGHVVCLEEKADPLTNERRICIGIFMNIFDVHVNRMPVDATVERIQYWPGKYFNASLDKASKFNERCGYCVRDSEGSTWSVVQIAGLIARRIVCRADIGDVLKRGERFGMIRFGSRVDLYLPHGYAPIVTMGQEVLAGQTVVACRREG